MKKGLRKIILFSVLFLVSLSGRVRVQAENELQNIFIEVELLEDGTGIVTEHRQMNMDEGTELYIELSNLQDSELLDFSVRNFEEEENWDLDASLEDKAGKYGVIETDDGHELVWGIGEYGQNTYELTYTISNLVRGLEDGQALLWNFDTFSNIPAENLTLNITGFAPFTEENTSLWGFGFEGNIFLRNGDVVWEAYEEVDDSNDVTVLLQFPEGFFNTQVEAGMTLEEQYEMAADGSAYNRESQSTSVFVLIIGAILALVGIGSAGAMGIYFSKVYKKKKEAGHHITGTKRLSKNKGMYYKQAPYEGGSLADIAYLLNEVHTGYFQDYFAAFLLKWVSEGKIDIHSEEQTSFFGKSFDTEIEIFNYEEEKEKHPLTFSQFMEEYEYHLSREPYETGIWIMLLDAADSKGMVSDDRVQKWAKTHAKDVEDYADYLEEYSKKALEKQDFLEFDKVRIWNVDHEIAVLSAEGDELFDQIVQFKNYLEETDLKEMADAESRVLSFETALIWSILYGRSDEITQQFDEMIPNPADVDAAYMPYYPYWFYVHGASGFKNNWSSGLSSGGFHSDASGGAGGMTSGGGGMGAGGGGGGGAR